MYEIRNMKREDAIRTFYFINHVIRKPEIYINKKRP
jgi:hypothetical protein